MSFFHPTRGARHEKGDPRRTGVFVFFIVAALVCAGAAALRAPLERQAARLVREALGDGVDIARVRLVPPNRIVVEGIRAEGLEVRSARITFDPVAALRHGVATALRRIDLTAPVIAAADLNRKSGEEPFSFPLPFSLPLSRSPGGPLPAGGAAAGPTVAARGGRLDVGGLTLHFDAVLRPRPDGLALEAAVSAAGEAAAVSGRATLSAYIPAAPAGTVRGTLLIESLRSPYFELAEGRADFTCNAGLAACSVGLNGRDGRFAHHPFTALRGELARTGAAWHLGELVLEGAAGARIVAAGEWAPPGGEPARSEESDPGEEAVPGDPAAGEGASLRLRIDAFAVPLSEALAWTGAPESVRAAVSGSTAGTVHVRGRVGALEVSGDGRFGPATLGGAAVDEGRWRFAFRPGGPGEGNGAGEESGVTVDAAVATGGGRIALERLRIGPAGGVHGVIALVDAPVPALVQAGRALGYLPWPGAAGLAGRLNGTVTLERASGEALAASFVLASERFSYRGAALAPLHVEGTWAGEGWRLDRLALLGPAGGPVGIEGEGRGRSADAFSLNLRWRGIGPDRLEAVTGLAPLGRLEGESAGELALRRTATGWTAEGTVAASLRASGVPIEVEGRVFTPAGAGIAAEGSLRAGSGLLDFAGSWDVRAGRREGAFQFTRFPAAVLGALLGVPLPGGEVGGALDVVAGGAGWEVGSRLTSPRLVFGEYALEAGEFVVSVRSAPGGNEPGCAGCLWGEAALRGELVESGRAGARGSPVNLVARLQGREILLEPAALALGDGRIELSGGARMAEGGEWLLALTSAGRSLRFRQAGIALALDYRASLGGTPARPALQGSVTVRDGEIDLFDLPPAGAGASGSSALGRLAVNAAVELQQVRVSARSLFSAEVGGVVRVQGGPGSPALFGTIEAKRGSFRYGRTLFDLERGAAHFHGPPLAPRLDVVGMARLGGRPVRVAVAGSPGELALSVAGEGGAGDPEGVAFSFGGNGDSAPVAEFSGVEWAELGRRFAAWFGDELVSDASWRLGRALEDALDVDQFRIVPDPEGGAPSLRLGKYVTPELYVSYRRSLLAQGGEELGLEYSLGPGASLETRWESGKGEGGEERRLGVGIRLPF